jgi:hypothetical protein
MTCHASDVSDLFPHHDDLYLSHRCAESILVEDIHTNYCIITRAYELVQNRQAPDAKMQEKMFHYKSFSDTAFEKTHPRFTQSTPCETVANIMSQIIISTEMRVWLI